jgi:flagellar biosynthesis protein FlhG
MLAIALAQGAAIVGKNAVLVDTDFATGGLTYYLTFRAFGNSRVGFSELLAGKSPGRLSEWAAAGRPEGPNEDWLSRVRLVSIGDPRRIRDGQSLDIAQPLEQVLREASDLGELVIVDCRGGIDSQSIAVCGMVDEIVIVVETDTTSIRASQHLADTLSDQNLKHKVAGFVLNKVMDDPTALAKTASSLLGTAYLGSIPFDIEATRSYIQGRIPDAGSLFSRHAFAILPRLMSGVDNYSAIQVLSPEEFGTVTLRSPEARLGGLIIFSMAFYLFVIYVWARYSEIFDFGRYQYWDMTILVFTNVLVFAALSDPIKQVIGRQSRRYLNFFRIFRARGARDWR